MAVTKAEERLALQKITAILDDLDDDSYVATAFAGCVEDAAANIENDWALSMSGRWNDALKRAENAEQSYAESRKEIADWACKFEAAQEEVKMLHGRVEHKEECVCNEHQRYLDELHRREAAEENVQKLEGELHWEKLRVTELKAKLYDYMVKEEEQK